MGKEESPAGKDIPESAAWQEEQVRRRGAEQAAHPTGAPPEPLGPPVGPGKFIEDLAGEPGVPLADAEAMLYAQKLRKETKALMRLSLDRQYLENPTSKLHSMTELLLARSSMVPRVPTELELSHPEQIDRLHRKRDKAVRTIVRAWRRKGWI